MQSSLEDMGQRFHAMRGQLEAQAQSRSRDLDVIHKYNQKLHTLTGTAYPKSPARSPARLQQDDAEAKQSLKRVQMLIERWKGTSQF